MAGNRDEIRGEAVVTSLRASGAKADFIAVDLGSADSARELARRATELGGGHVDTLVNNAAIFPMGPAASMAQDGAGSNRAAASPDEIAAAITDLASDGASFVHSAIFAVDGGRTAA